MAESFRTRIARWRFNLFPAYRGTGGRITYIAGDWLEVRINLRLNRRTRNYVGTTFGGSMYGAVDPVYMLMLIKALGMDYVVWDKAAAIHFKKPGRATLYARFVLSREGISSIRDELTRVPSIERVYHVDLTDADGAVHAAIDKTIHIRRKEAG
jgi:acyl-coenzyme A thioesterase PaaI-like protein